jgi:ABC-type tungstate transport system substrate-binding protein
MTDGMQYVTEVCVCVCGGGGVNEISKAVVTAIMRVCNRGGYGSGVPLCTYHRTLSLTCSAS